MALLASCATEPKVLQIDAAQETAGESIVWPAPPEVPRYRYLGQLQGEANFKQPEGSRQTDFKTALKWLVGLSDEKRSEKLLRPQSGTVDAAGRIYVTDLGRGAVFVFDIVAGELQVWNKAEGMKNFMSPVGIALVPGGVLVADSQLGIVARLDAEGNPRRSIGRGILKRPSGLAYDPEGKRIYVSDTGAHDIKVFDDEGRLLKTIGRRGEGEGEFNFPTHLAFVRGELYVADTMNSRIQVLGKDGEEVKLRFGSRGTGVGDLTRAKGVAVDSEGDIYVVESYYDHMLVFNRSGALLLGIGGKGTAPGNFDLPTGVWVDSSNRVFVADMLNGRVAIFQFLGGNK